MMRWPTDDDDAASKIKQQLSNPQAHLAGWISLEPTMIRSITRPEALKITAHCLTFIQILSSTKRSVVGNWTWIEVYINVPMLSEAQGKSLSISGSADHDVVSLMLQQFMWRLKERDILTPPPHIKYLENIQPIKWIKYFDNIKFWGISKAVEQVTHSKKDLLLALWGK